MCMSYNFVKYTPKYFVLFDAVINGIVKYHFGSLHQGSPVSFIFSLIFIFSFLLFTLDLDCSSFSSFLK